MAGPSAARKAAFEILLAIERGRSHSDDLLRGRAVEKLAPADRNLTTALVLGTLRWQIRLDHELHALLAKPNAKLDDEVRIALRLGALQLRRMDRIPAHAAIDQSVELTRRAGHRFASRMVNAVLRRLATAAPADWAENSATELALAEAHPQWMVERWARFHGLDAARAICAHGQRQPAAVIRVPDAAAEAGLVAKGFELRPGSLLSHACVLAQGDAAAAEAVRAGRVRVQDEGSQLVAELAGRGASILDLCAAPGGKTLILAERNRAGRIVASEASQPRMHRLQERLRPLGDRVECRLADATEWAEEGAFDVVLADVPCSGTGTLGRNPEIRHRLREEDLARHAERQRAILSSALRAAKPGGQVIYSTCSLEPEENEEVVRAVLAERADAKAVPLAERIEELRGEGIVTAEGARQLAACITPEGWLRLLPGVLGTDGFFVARVDRTN
ncbi:MAG TPA: transcription antitermination factor NusB [Terracidiphilus sp.]|nr:transcription antitermination factor NusB [Terracidiphilus sp.]